MSKAILPINVTRINSHMPCESCSLKRSTHRATLNPPGDASVTHYLCENCLEGIRQ